MFFFSISGSTSFSTSLHCQSFYGNSDLTYACSILLISLETRYLIANASWLAGSVLTIFLDIFVISQFMYYHLEDRRQEKERKVLGEGDDREDGEGEGV